MKAINIDWDIDCDENIEEIELPTEIIIPDNITDDEEISDYISNVSGYCHNGYILIKDFLDIKVGDDVIAYDEYNHDYEEHHIKVENIEYDKENTTETNPEGMVCYGKDLSFWNEEQQDYDGDEYITRVTESNFIRHIGGNHD